MSETGLSQLDLDRLVDGDLAPAERCRVLAVVAAEPDGWKRCALAYLEDQSWRRACRGLLSEASAADASVAVSSLVPTARRWRALTVGFTVAAAVSLAAFFVGRSLGHRQGTADAIAAAIPKSGDSATPDGPQATGDQNSSLAGKATSESGHEAHRGVHIVGVVKFDGAEGQRNSVPLVAAPGLDEKRLLSRPQTMSEYERHQWERRGWEIKEHRKVITVQLADGRQLSIPLDLVSVKPQPHGVF